MSDKLFTPLRVGNNTLQHRVIMAPLTRLRCDENWVPTDLVKEHYLQRAAVPGTLIVSEGTHVSKRFIGLPHVSGIWSPEQIKAWKDINDAVHAKGSFMWCQLWNMGRASTYALAAKVGTKVYGPSPIKLSDAPDSDVPVEMTKEDIKNAIDDYVQAAKNAIEAGFDGVQLHCANGYIVDQFLQDVTNHRTDEYGGSIENRSRFAYEALSAIVAAVGPDRVGIRFSPWGTFGEVGMKDPVPQFTDIITKASALKIAYLDLVEPRISGTSDREVQKGQDNGVFLKAWTNGKPVWLSGGFTAELARKRVEEIKDHEVAIVVGRYFTSNPDLVYRFKHNLKLTPYDRSKFYTPMNPDGYTTWEFSKEFLAAQAQEGSSRL